MNKVFELYGFQMVTHFEIESQPFKPFYYLFKKNPEYSHVDIPPETKMSMLTTIVGTMRASNVFSNGNIFKEVVLNDFDSNVSESVSYSSILSAELERTELQMVRNK